MNPPNGYAIARIGLNKTHMKSFRHLFILAGLALGAASPSFAGAGLQQWQTLRTESEFKNLKAGDDVAIVCEACKSVTTLKLESAAQGAALAKEGATVECPACKAGAKVSVREGHAVQWVDPKGHETLFIVKASGSK